LPFNALGTPECFDPFIHARLKCRGFLKGINSHCTEEMARSFSLALFKHGQVCNRRRYKRPEICPGKNRRENIYYGSKAVTLMTSMFTVAAKWKRMKIRPSKARIR